VRIVIVDNNSGWRNITHNYIRAISPKYPWVTVAQSVEEALSYDYQYVKLIITDWNMEPGCSDGIDFVLNLRRRGITIPIVMLAGPSRQKSIDFALHCGVTQYIKKKELTLQKFQKALERFIK